MTTREEHWCRIDGDHITCASCGWTSPPCPPDHAVDVGVAHGQAARAVTWADVPQGSYPNMTGGMSPREYLEDIRGES